MVVVGRGAVVVVTLGTVVVVVGRGAVVVGATGVVATGTGAVATGTVVATGGAVAGTVVVVSAAADHHGASVVGALIGADGGAAGVGRVADVAAVGSSDGGVAGGSSASSGVSSSTTTTASGGSDVSAVTTTAGAELRTGSAAARSTIGAADTIDPTLVAAMPATAERPTALVTLAPAEAAVEAMPDRNDAPAAEAEAEADAAPAAAVEAAAPVDATAALPATELTEPADDAAPLEALLPADAVPLVEPLDDWARADWGKRVNWAKNDSGPITRRSPPSDRARKARTTAGSKWLPAQRASSMRASDAGRAFLYDRAEVITSNTSATATIRAERAISVLRNPRGYPEPSHFSWCCETAYTPSPSQPASGLASS